MREDARNGLLLGLISYIPPTDDKLVQSTAQFLVHDGATCKGAGEWMNPSLFRRARIR